MIDAADYDGLGELFAHGALLDPNGRVIARGRDAISDFYRSTVILYDGSPRTEHVTSDSVIDIDESARTATSSSNYVVHQVIDGERVLVAAGRYRDRFSRPNGGWLFTERQFFLDDTPELARHIRIQGAEVRTD